MKPKNTRQEATLLEKKKKETYFPGLLFSDVKTYKPL